MVGNLPSSCPHVWKKMRQKRVPWMTLGWIKHEEVPLRCLSSGYEKVATGAGVLSLLRTPLNRQLVGKNNRKIGLWWDFFTFSICCRWHCPTLRIFITFLCFINLEVWNKSCWESLTTVVPLLPHTRRWPYSLQVSLCTSSSSTALLLLQCFRVLLSVLQRDGWILFLEKVFQIECCSCSLQTASGVRRLQATLERLLPS